MGAKLYEMKPGWQLLIDAGEIDATLQAIADYTGQQMSAVQS